MALTQEHLARLSAFVAKYDAKDKLTGLLQYGAMFLADGQPGVAKNVQARMAASRRVFRVLNETNPAKAMMAKPGLGQGPLVLEVLEKVKLISFAGYCVGNHTAFLGEVGFLQDKELTANAGKASLWGWCLSSLAGALIEAYHIAHMAAARREGEDEAAWRARKAAAQAELNTRLLTMVHGLSMVLLSLGLLQKIPLRQRTMGALGVFSSAVSCYRMFPPSAAKHKTA
mmetsp:Transcript_43517/g.111271  ORF Transcript_43517/g.111271 Transcript_43517/m.111271 type:complete len:228 (+) Transcript_43517:159-842(+)